MRITIVLFTVFLLTIPCYSATIYVDQGAIGTGSSWADAYGSFQDALDAAAYGDNIYVAQGTYYPDPNGLADPRQASFQMTDGVTIYGGFPSGEDTFENRDPSQYQTILSGDLLGNDNPATQPQGLLDDPSRADNCYHVFYHPEGLALDLNAVLDGFMITAGNADGISPHYCGGGMYNSYGSPTVTNCIFTGNSARFGGGGIYNDNSSPTVISCTFTGNSAGDGGGISNWRQSSPAVSNCTFSGDSADYGSGMANYFYSSPTIDDSAFSDNTADGGAGIFNYFYSSPIVNNCTLDSNSADYGGAIANYVYSDPTLTVCTSSSNSADGGGGIANFRSSPTVNDSEFSENTANSEGGAMLNDYSSPTLTRCTFSTNSTDLTDGTGGAICNKNNSPTVTNCTFSGNSANQGGAMTNWQSSPTVTNCILWNNSAASGNEIAIGESSVINVKYCDVEGGLNAIDDDLEGNTINWGNSTIDTDPLFVDAFGGDYHLRSEGWRWDITVNQWTWDAVTSPCIDAGNPGSPLAAEPMTLNVDPLNRFGQNLRINMGAHGGTARAAMPIYGWALLADLTNDGTVNLEDFAAQTSDWQNTDNQQSGDLNRTGTVNLNDVLLMANDWLVTTVWH